MHHVVRLSVDYVIYQGCYHMDEMAILPDLGRPLGMWRLFFAPNVASPLLLDVRLLFGALAFGMLLVIGLRFAKAVLAKVGAVGSAVFAVLLPLGTAVMFCSVPGKLGWESTAEIGIALVQVLLAGVAVVLLTKGVADRVGDKLSKAAVALIAGEAMLLLYRGDFALMSMQAVMFGTYAPLFWLQIIVGLAVPAVMLALRKVPVVAAGLALLGIFLSKYVYVIRGSIYPTYSELSEGLYIPTLQHMPGPQMIPAYLPTMNEHFVGAAVVALAVLLLVIANNSKLVPSDETPSVD